MDGPESDSKVLGAAGAMVAAARAFELSPHEQHAALGIARALLDVEAVNAEVPTWLERVSRMRPFQRGVSRKES